MCVCVNNMHFLTQIQVHILIVLSLLKLFTSPHAIKGVPAIIYKVTFLTFNATLSLHTQIKLYINYTHPIQYFQIMKEKEITKRQDKKIQITD